MHDWLHACMTQRMGLGNLVSCAAVRVVLRAACEGERSGKRQGSDGM
jgi:hypothetical protein